LRTGEQRDHEGDPPGRDGGDHGQDIFGARNKELAGRDANLAIKHGKSIPNRQNSSREKRRPQERVDIQSYPSARALFTPGRASDDLHGEGA
jgi:hypothetical protein